MKSSVDSARPSRTYGSIHGDSRPPLLYFAYIRGKVHVSAPQRHSEDGAVKVSILTKFGGGGAPDWTVEKYPRTEAGMRQAVSDFWNSSSLQDHLINIWTKIAKRYANESAVAGYDILNEPWIYSSIDHDLNASHVNAFYTRAITVIRRVDVNHLIFLEPANLHTSSFPLKDNIVWSPHFYALSFAPKYYAQNITMLESDFIAKYKQFVLDMVGPMWIGEFGTFMRGQSQQDWLRDAVNVFGRYNVGWAWWAYGCGSTLPSALVSLQP